MGASNTHTYRGIAIVQFDTGGRCMGRERGYRFTVGGSNHMTLTVAAARKVIDMVMDRTPEQAAHADAIAALLMGGK